MRLSILAAILLSIAFTTGQSTCAQSDEFKRELFNRGLTSLRAQKKPDDFQLNNAFDAACSVDSATLVEPLIKEFKIQPFDVFSGVIQNADCFGDLELAFRNLRPGDLTMDHSRLVGDFAEQLGHRNGDIERMLKKLEPFLRNQPSKLKDGSELSSDAIFERRVSELRHIYQRSRLHEEETASPRSRVLLEFRTSVDDVADKKVGIHVGPTEKTVKKKPGQPARESGFQSALEEIPWEQQPKWIVDFVLRYGWQHRSVKPGEYPDEEAILNAFEKCKDDDPDVADQLAQCIDSMTSPTDAAKDLMLRMMKMMPEEKQIATRHEVYLLTDRIEKAEDSELDNLLVEANRMLEKPNHWSNDFPAMLAYAFAVKGNQQAVNSLLSRIKDAEDQTWYLFQCAKAFPPRCSERIWFSKRQIGGIF